MKKITLSVACASFLLATNAFGELAYLSTLKKSHDIMNLEKARQENPQINGGGVKIGIVDTNFVQTHPSLSGRAIEISGVKYDDELGDPNKISGYRHGTHIAGIILGNDLGNEKPKGIAPNATFYGVQSKYGYYFYNTNPSISIDLYNYFKSRSEVKIINNSRAVPLGMDTDISNIRNLDQAIRIINQPNDEQDLKNLVALSKDKKVLNIFGAGNRGKDDPEITARLPYYDHDLLAWLAVGALNADYIEKAPDGKMKIKNRGILQTSNTLKDVVNFGLMAPGGRVISANAYYNRSDLFLGYIRGACNQADQYERDLCKTKEDEKERNHNIERADKIAEFFVYDGTSQATAMVSGVAALVSQKFPFLDGKQIADVLLSTANQNYELPKFIVRNYGYDTLKITYIDQPVPDDSEIRADLTQAGYSETQITKILRTKTSLTRSQVMGQGIVDAQKALRGLAVLDANRLSLSDIKNIIGKDEAYYTINTHGKNGEFSNNISQKKWDNNLHLATALNSPADRIRNLDVGFIKEGSGILTFSGENSYEGATIVRGGRLNLKEGSKLTHSNVYVENGGTLSGNGEISKDLTNKGIVQVGSENDIKDLNVRGKYTQEGANSALILNFDKTGNSKLIASAYDIKSGKLQYRPLIGVNYAGGQEIRIGLGNLENQINNFTKVEILSTNTMDFKLNTDKLHINKQGMDVLPNTNVDPNANQNPNIIVKPEVKSDAFEVDNSDMGGVLRDIKQKGGLNAEYNDYFAKLDYVDKSTYKETLSSISSESYLANSTDMISTQYRSTQNNMLFALNPMSFTNILTANTLTEPVMLASIGDDTMTFKIINDSREPYKNTAFYLTPRFKKTNGDDYNAKSYGFDMGVASAITDGQILALSINYSKSDSDFKHADFDSKYANLGINYSADITKGFKILSGFGLGYGKTDFSRNVVLSNDKLNASYKNLFASAQLGVAKDFVHDELTITPLVYLNYNLIRQNAFNESGGLFAREYDKINHNTTSVSTGVNLNYIVKNEKNIMQFGGYALYERRLSGKKFDNKVKFKDFDNSYFTQKYELDANLFTLGLNSQFDFKNGVFTRLGLINEFSSKRKSSSILATFGYKF